MAMQELSPAPLLTEPVPIFETFTTGLADAAECGGFFRLTFYVDRPLVGTLVSERAVVARLIVPKSAYDRVLTALSAARGREIGG